MIDFQNAKILDYTHSNSYFGEIFRFGTRKNISLQGEIYALTNTSGVQPIWSGMSGFVNGAVDYSDITINGVNFGPGRIDSISFDDGIDVRRKNYSVSLTIFDSGNLFNLTGQYYSNLGFLTGIPIYLLESFSENFSYDVSESKEGTFEQNISIRFVSGAANSGSLNPIYLAKVLASGLLNSSPAFPILSGEFGEHVGGKKYITETYNQITNECSFGFRSKVGPGAEMYSFTYSNSLNVNQEGIATAAENGKINGLISDVWNAAQSGFAIEFANSFTRCQSIYSAHGLTSSLNAQYTSLSRANDKFKGSIEYDVSFSDNPNLNDTYIWEYTHEITRAEPCIFNVTEAGNIKGRNNTCSALNNYTNALNGWAIVKPGISGRSQYFYEDATLFTKPLKLVGRSESKSELNAEINYNYLYTDNSFYGVSGFKKIDYSVEDKMPVPLVSKFNIASVKELVQPAYIATVGTRSMSLQLIGNRDKPLSDYLAFAKDFLNTFVPTGGDVFINDNKYTFAPLESSFDIQNSWSFFGGKDFTDTSV
jgi:hypothetical protein